MATIKCVLANSPRIHILFVVSLCLLACNRSFRPAVKTGFEGTPLSAFDILLPDSSTILSTSRLLKGDPTVLIYFSPNCPYSQAEMSNIIEDMSNLKSVRFFIFTSWPFQQFRGFYAYYKLDKFPNITVGQDFKNYFSGHYKPMGVPFTMIYDKDGKLSTAFVGTMPGRQIEELALRN